MIWCFSFGISYSQYAKLYPTCWWAGMKWNRVQLLIRGDQSLENDQIKINYPGLTVIKSFHCENKKYIILDLALAADVKPGIVKIQFAGNNMAEWTIKARRPGNGSLFAQGVRSSDFIYLLMPDRYSNGDPSNDRVRGMKDQSLNRDSIFLRHGGDLQGIINHLDYIEGLGVTALWMTPVIENDMPDRTEHGYAFTNHYKIEPRLGTADTYKTLSDQLHGRGMKLIQDAVYNHMGLYNFLMQDAPAIDWVHRWPELTKPNYRDQVHFDPYVSKSDKKRMLDGWFTSEMPDLNQSNPFVADFLIQHALWCTEEFGVDAWRIDTYIYVDPVFMNKCNQALLNEYPKITLFGESWVDGVASQAYFAKNNYKVPFKSNLTGALDFQVLFHGIQPALTQPPQGVNQLYQTLGNDFLYKDATNNVIFLDNHDMSRFFSVVSEDVNKMKMGIQWLLTERGIPQMYYGTEILMKGVSNPDGLVRLDFPGGWENDVKNAFKQNGLSSNEKQVQELTRKLGNFRKRSSAIKTGNLMHYAPQDGLYVYFRYNKDQTVMCVMNTSLNNKNIDFNDYRERTLDFVKAKNIITGELMNMSDKPQINGTTMWVLELIK